MPFHLGPLELGLTLVIILMVFGAGKLPQVGEAMRKGLNAFSKRQSGKDDEEAPPSPRRKITRKKAAGKTNQAAS